MDTPPPVTPSVGKQVSFKRILVGLLIGFVVAIGVLGFYLYKLRPNSVAVLPGAPRSASTEQITNSSQQVEESFDNCTITDKNPLIKGMETTANFINGTVLGMVISTGIYGTDPNLASLEVASLDKKTIHKFAVDSNKGIIVAYGGKVLRAKDVVPGHQVLLNFSCNRITHSGFETNKVIDLSI